MKITYLRAHFVDCQLKFISKRINAHKNIDFSNVTVNKWFYPTTKSLPIITIVFCWEYKQRAQNAKYVHICEILLTLSHFAW